MAGLARASIWRLSFDTRLPNGLIMTHRPRPTYCIPFQRLPGQKPPDLTVGHRMLHPSIWYRRPLLARKTRFIPMRYIPFLGFTDEPPSIQDALHNDNESHQLTYQQFNPYLLQKKQNIQDESWHHSQPTPKICDCNAVKRQHSRGQASPKHASSAELPSTSSPQNALFVASGGLYVQCEEPRDVKFGVTLAIP